MLFDEKDYNVFNNDYEKDAFQEVIQTYYSKNYRSSIVALYSLVMLNLYNKLQFMSEEGEEKAKTELKRINKLIDDDEKYSQVEKEITDFFKNNYSLHFSKFSRDLDYLKSIRDDCAHLKVDSSSLLIPKDYQVKMLICSMFENLFSVKAPFLDDLFSFVSDDIEIISNGNSSILRNRIDESIRVKYEKKYFSRMTQSSLVKSLRTFIKLLFISDEANAVKNSRGLYIFTRCMIDYIDKIGLSVICIQDIRIQELISKIDKDGIVLNPIREDALFCIICTCRWFCDEIKGKDIFQYIIDKYLFQKDAFEKYFDKIYPERVTDKWNFYIENANKFTCHRQRGRFDYLKDDPDFSDAEFIGCEANKVPTWSGFDDAEDFMGFFFDVMEELSDEAIEVLLSVYNTNTQYYNRRNSYGEMKKLIKETKRRKMNIDWNNYSNFSSLANDNPDDLSNEE